VGDHHRLQRCVDGGPKGKLTEAVRALYWRRPSAAEAGEWGLRVEDYPAPEVALWPENWPPIELFNQLSTQWRTGPGGAIGLDYNVIFHELDRRSLSTHDYDEMMASIRHIERAALEEMQKD
jgi:hypothetical protein